MLHHERDPHVIARQVQFFRVPTEEEALALKKSICAQDLYFNLNTDPEDPIYGVTVTNEVPLAATYQVDMAISDAVGLVANISITRDKTSA